MKCKVSRIQTIKYFFPFFFIMQISMTCSTFLFLLHNILYTNNHLSCFKNRTFQKLINRICDTKNRFISMLQTATAKFAFVIFSKISVCILQNHLCFTEFWITWTFQVKLTKSSVKRELINILKEPTKSKYQIMFKIYHEEKT